MTIGRHYLSIEFTGGYVWFAHGSQLVANYVESHLTIAGVSFIKRSVVERGENVKILFGRKPQK